MVGVSIGSGSGSGCSGEKVRISELFGWENVAPKSDRNVRGFRISGEFGFQVNLGRVADIRKKHLSSKH